MKKTELIELLSDVPEDAEICIEGISHGAAEDISLFKTTATKPRVGGWRWYTSKAKGVIYVLRRASDVMGIRNIR